MRIATYNVEWFGNLFDDDGVLLDDGGWSGRQDVTRADQLGALGIVFAAMDADAVMVIEAPDQNRRRDGARALEAFADAMGLRARKALIGFANDTQQEIALLFDPDKLEARHDPIGDEGGKVHATAAPRFDTWFRIDLDIDAHADRVAFSKPPLEAALRSRATGMEFRMIGVHLKSKAPHGARGEDAMMRMAIANRRKQLAQAIWLRARVEEHLAAGEPLIVLGDLNDGPGLDEYEKLFGRSSVEIVLGTADGPHLVDPHASRSLTRPLGERLATSRFFLRDQNRYLQALLDYVMLSPDLAARNAVWRIWHPFDDPICWSTPELRAALLTASDHFPVTVDLDL